MDELPTHALASNGCGPPRLHSARLVAAVAELGRSAEPVRNTLGMISNLLINTSLQRGVGGANSWQTVLEVRPPRGRPLKRFSFSAPWITRLKPGVNESGPAWDAEFKGSRHDSEFAH